MVFNIEFLGGPLDGEVRQVTGFPSNTVIHKVPSLSESLGDINHRYELEARRSANPRNDSWLYVYQYKEIV